MKIFKYYIEVFLSLLFCLTALNPTPLLAQDTEVNDDPEIESLYDRIDSQETAKRQKRLDAKPVEEKQINTVSDLSNLEPFSDVAVIQRKFLPTSGRFEVSGSGFFGLNNAFFTNLGGAVRAAYYFTSKLSVEASYYALTATEKQVTKDLKDLTVKTESLVTPKSYTGVAARWTPIYGKMALLGKKINQFEMFFSAGLGTTDTENGSAATIHLGTGQNFAINKGMAFRWDAGVNYYQPEVVLGSDIEKQNQYDIFVALGVSFYFPEATYR
ncbi:MAG: outer membrane beta-barrel domain-containing protein [Bdellovibrionales bacterium]